MVTTRPAHRPSRRTEIMHAALCELGRDGMTGEQTTIGAIARRAGVTSAAMYYHFASRSELMAAVLGEVHPEVMALFETTPRTNSAGAGWIDGFITAVADWVVASPEAARFYFLVAPHLADEAVAEQCSTYRAEFLDGMVERINHHRAGIDASVAWVRAHALREILICAIELGMEGRECPKPGFHELRRAGRVLFTDLFSASLVPTL